LKSIHLNSALIKKEAIRLGFNDCGISRADFLDVESERLESWLNKGYHARLGYLERNSDKRTDPRLLVDGAKSVISVILNYYPSQTQKDSEAPVLSKYYYGKDHHQVVKKKLADLLNFIRKKIPGSDGRAFTDSVPLLEKAFASRGGLGWIGKNSLLLTEKFGSFVYIGELIVNIELEYDQPVKDLCGTCNKCTIACPTGALSTEHVLNANRCISFYTIENKTDSMPENLRGFFHNRVFGCDICQDVCPWNKKAKSHNIKEFTPHPELLTLSKKEWHSIDRVRFNELFKGSAVKRAKFEGLRRNIIFLEREV
jgi:epoxyqueuosine reductase